MGETAAGEAARPAFEAARARYYGNRYNELRKQDLLEAADTVGELFVRRDTWHYDTLVKALADSPDNDTAAARVQVEQLLRLGYLWRPGGGQDCEPGIPSLVNYVRDEMATTREQNQALARVGR